MFGRELTEIRVRLGLTHEEIGTLMLGLPGFFVRRLEEHPDDALNPFFVARLQPWRR